jgi:hypothetical protein
MQDIECCVQCNVIDEYSDGHWFVFLLQSYREDVMKLKWGVIKQSWLFYEFIRAGPDCNLLIITQPMNGKLNSKQIILLGGMAVFCLRWSYVYAKCTVFTMLLVF